MLMTNCKIVSADWNQVAEEKLRITGSSTEISEFLKVIEALAEPVDDFMENIFVMAEEEDLRKNRLTLLQCVADLPRGIMDPAELPGF